jgi:SAM-dependent methyltransferase
MLYIHPVHCLLCSSREYKTIFLYCKPDQYETTLGVSAHNYHRAWVRCRRCGFYYSRSSRPPALIHRIYTSFYRSARTPWRAVNAETTFKKIVALPKKKSETLQRVAWLREQIATLQSNNIVKLGKPPWKFLDIGGGGGIFASAFATQEWQPSIIDPGADTTFIREKLGIPLVQKLYIPRAFGKPFSLISLIYVLEHVRNPQKFLLSVRKDLRAGGVLFVEVPDTLNFRFKNEDDDIFNACHLWMFDPTSLTQLFRKCGFETIAFKRFPAMRGHFGLMMLAQLTKK